MCASLHIAHTTLHIACATLHIARATLHIARCYYSTHCTCYYSHLHVLLFIITHATIHIRTCYICTCYYQFGVFSQQKNQLTSPSNPGLVLTVIKEPRLLPATALLVVVHCSLGFYALEAEEQSEGATKGPRGFNYHSNLERHVPISQVQIITTSRPDGCWSTAAKDSSKLGTFL